MTDVISNNHPQREGQGYELKDLLNPQDSSQPDEISVEIKSEELVTKKDPSPRTEKLEKIFTKEEQTNIRIFINSLTKGIPTSFTYADYYYCILTLKILIGLTPDITLFASTAYFSSYYTVFMLCLITGVIDAQSNSGAQAYGRKDYKKVNLYFRQSLLVAFTLFLAFVASPTIFVERVLLWLNVDPELASESQRLIIISLPAIFMRILNDNIKAFLQNQGYLQEIGFASVSIFLVFLPVSHWLIITKGMGALGFALSILIYETGCCLACVVILKLKCSEEVLDCSESIFQDILYYYKYTASIFLTRLPAFMCWNVTTLMLGSYSTQADLAAFTTALNFSQICYAGSRGVVVYIGTIINQKLGEGKLKEARELFVRCFRVNMLFAVVFCLMFGVISGSLVIFRLFSSEEVITRFTPLVFIIMMNCFIVTNYNMCMKIIYSHGYMKQLAYSQVCDLALLPLNFYLSCYLGYGSSTGYLCPVIGLYLKVSVCFYYLFFKIDWMAFKSF